MLKHNTEFDFQNMSILISSTIVITFICLFVTTNNAIIYQSHHVLFIISEVVNLRSKIELKV